MDQKISPGTIARTIILALALINQLLSLSGHSILPISDDLVNALVTNIWTIAAAIIAWWKNNSFTQAALSGDAVMKQQKIDSKPQP